MAGIGVEMGLLKLIFDECDKCFSIYDPDTAKEKILSIILGVVCSSEEEEKALLSSNIDGYDIIISDQLITAIGKGDFDLSNKNLAALRLDMAISVAWENARPGLFFKHDPTFPSRLDAALSVMSIMAKKKDIPPFEKLYKELIEALIIWIESIVGNIDANDEVLSARLKVAEEKDPHPGN